MVQTLGEGNPYWKTVTSAAELLDVVKNNRASHIQLLEQTYDVGSNIISPTLTSDVKRLHIRGMGEGSLLVGSGTKVVDVQNVAWVNVQAIELENMKIEHNCSNATDITLDLRYSHPFMRNVWMIQTNGTRQGSPCYMGPTGAGGLTQSSENVTCSNYGAPLDIAMDHHKASNWVMNYFEGRAFYMHDSLATILDKPQVMCLDAASAAACYPFVANHSLFGCEIREPNLELGAQNLTNTMFSHENTGPPAFIVTNPSADKALGATFRDANSRNINNYRFLGQGNNILCQNWGFDTGTGAQQTTAHGLADIPRTSGVILSENTTGGALAYRSAASDATNIYVTATLNKTWAFFASL